MGKSLVINIAFLRMPCQICDTARNVCRHCAEKGTRALIVVRRVLVSGRKSRHYDVVYVVSNLEYADNCSLRSMRNRVVRCFVSISTQVTNKVPGIDTCIPNLPGISQYLP